MKPSVPHFRVRRCLAGSVKCARLRAQGWLGVELNMATGRHAEIGKLDDADLAGQIVPGVGHQV